MTPAVSPLRIGILSTAKIAGATHWSGATPQESRDIARMIDAVKRSAATGAAEPVRRG